MADTTLTVNAAVWDTGWTNRKVKIGDTIFVHGGLSPALEAMGFSTLEQINQRVSDELETIPAVAKVELHGVQDEVIEIEVDGAQQVKRLYPDALLLFVVPPSREEQERRLRGRGDPGDKVLARLKKAEVEEPIGRRLADHIVVNDDLDATIDEMLEIIEGARARTDAARHR